MNGEVKQICDIVLSARKAIYDGQTIDFTLPKWVYRIQFEFIPRLFGRRKAESVSEWYGICKKRGFCDIQFIIPTKVQERHLLGFANTAQPLIACYWKNNAITYFHPSWIPGEKGEGWTVVYQEFRLKDFRPVEVYTDQTEAFKNVLLGIAEFAKVIDSAWFSDVFLKAHKALCDFSTIENHSVPFCVPDEYKGIYYAAETADVFGAMGSWNDSPPCIAYKMGLNKEYEEWSDRLLKQIRYNMMYVVNESWRKN